MTKRSKLGRLSHLFNQEYISINRAEIGRLEEMNGHKAKDVNDTTVEFQQENKQM